MVLYAYVVGQSDQYLSYLVVTVIYNEFQRKIDYQIAYHGSVLLKILLNINSYITVSILLTTVCVAPNMDVLVQDCGNSISNAIVTAILH